MAIEREQFRGLLRRWASGVAIVTGFDGEQAHGMTVSSFTSVSAEPPRVLVCAARGSRTRGLIVRSGRYAISVLGEAQQQVGAIFADPREEASRLERVAWSPGLEGLPLIDGALAHLECRLSAAHEEGTHTLLVGEVLQGAVGPAGSPLLYFDGAYRRLG